MLPDPEGFACPRRSCGDHIELYLRIRDEVVVDARFLSEGCLQVMACGSAPTCLIKGQPLGQAARVNARQIAAELGGLDPQHQHCAELAEQTLQAAVRDYFRRQQAPWEGAFRRR